MDVNELTYEMRSADGPWPVDSTYPRCERPTTLGPLWPQPTSQQLSGLKTLYGLANQYGMRIMLVLNTTHMDQPDSNAPWLRAIIETVKDLPAFDLVAFGGDRHAVDAQPPYDGVPDSCGGESEAPLWLGPDSPQGRYVQWAIAYGRSLGVPPHGFHLTNVPNGSFEAGATGWKIAGNAESRPLDENAPWRGTSYLRLTGTAISARIRVSPSTRYTTTAHLRFSRPSTVSFRYLTCKNKPSAKRKLDTFRPAGPQPSFQTFPLVYTTPADACWLRIELSAPTPIDVDALR